MSHRDAVSVLPEGFRVSASTDTCPVAAMECPERRLFATQFHPEVHHTPFGQQLLENFLFGVCDLIRDWDPAGFVDLAITAIRNQVGDDRVIVGLSGGVDSTVVAELCARAVGKQLTCVFVNHGLLRAGEAEEVEAVFGCREDVNFVHVHAEDRFAAKLAEVTDPEAKRRIIGGEFWKVFFEEAQRVGGVKYLALIRLFHIFR